MYIETNLRNQFFSDETFEWLENRLTLKTLNWGLGLVLVYGESCDRSCLTEKLKLLVVKILIVSFLLTNLMSPFV